MVSKHTAPIEGLYLEYVKTPTWLRGKKDNPIKTFGRKLDQHFIEEDTQMVSYQKWL